jgi:hypothetical protein
LEWLKGAMHCPCRCGSGCGECYCGDWHSDPPDCCDPCDCHGNWTGHGCAHCNQGPGYPHGPLPPPAASPELIPGDAEPMPPTTGRPTPAPPRAPQSTRNGYVYPNGYAGAYPQRYGYNYGPGYNYNYAYGPGYGSYSR